MLLRYLKSYICNSVAELRLLKKIKDKFKDYPAVAEEVEKRGLTAEQIHEDPTILLEILDKSLQ